MTDGERSSPAPTFVESGFAFYLANVPYFRFCELRAYQTLKGQGLKEMDVGWCSDDGRIVLLEVKRYPFRSKLEDFQSSDGTRISPEELARNLEGKIADSLLMLTAAWAGTPIGSDLADELPECVRDPGRRIRLIVAFNVPEDKAAYFLTAIRDDLNKRLERTKGRLHLCNAGTNVSVLDGPRLQRQFPDLVRIVHEQ